MTDAAVGRAGRPRTVEAAFALSLAAIALQAVVWVLGTFVVSPTGLEELRGELGRDGATRQLAVPAGLLAALGALWLLFCFRMRAGDGRARIALTVVGLFSGLFFLNALSKDGFRWTADGGIGDLLLTDLLPDLLAAGAIVMMFLPASNAYFSAARREGR
ncbi:hypothetical protein IQ279_03930 [Streptomyces verrucosisporus]|uniref:hypothetical protein n=1 Tax=Streptomyces verrucosisporus TaxID=1695161 RepID=UPI0019D090D4|nr:hypothetical protein [Streptomyces verrucosisporus]MBN3928800.1 hypothetical protein [Streptomyces verrucosisporus]